MTYNRNKYPYQQPTDFGRGHFTEELIPIGIFEYKKQESSSNGQDYPVLNELFQGF